MAWKMISDSYTYDLSGNPQKIYFTNGSITKYVYSATGQKLRMVHYTAKANITRTIGQQVELKASEIQSTDSTDYLLGGSLVVRNGKIDKYLFDGGYAQATASGTTDKFTFYYQNKDHLGTVRETVTSAGAMKQRVNYYPFGGQLVDTLKAMVLNRDFQQYKYNGKEFDGTFGLNTYDYGARQHYPILARWDRIDPHCEKYYGISPYAYCGDAPVNKIDPDGMDEYYSPDGRFLYKDDKKTEYVFVGENQLMLNGKPITATEFQNKASTIYAESSIGYGIADPKEMCSIASVHLRNNKAFGQGASLAKAFRSTSLSKQTKSMQMANAALINALQGGTDYSNGATQWDGAEQAMVPLQYMDKPSNGRFMFKMNTMGWSMSDEDYSSWKTAVENKFGIGKFTVPQEKSATSNYGGMKNKGRIRLQSTAQYGLTIFWKETK